MPCAAFDVSDLSAYSSVAIKTMRTTDTLRPDKRHTLEITGTRGLESVLGTDTKSFQTLYVYIGDKTIKEYDTSKWYYYYQPSWNGRGRGKLHYRRNDVMASGRVGDMLVVARRPDDDLLMLIIQQGHPVSDTIMAHLGIVADSASTQQKSWWQKLWGTSDNVDQTADVETAPLPGASVSERSWMRVYFTPGPDCEDNIVAELERAKTIDIAVYSITNEKIGNAIIAAHNRGARVRIITDRLMAQHHSSLVKTFSDAGIPVLTSHGVKIEHNKFTIFDGKTVVNGSYNWTANATKYNSENCTFFDQPASKKFSARFEELWQKYEK